MITTLKPKIPALSVTGILSGVGQVGAPVRRPPGRHAGEAVPLESLFSLAQEGLAASQAAELLRPSVLISAAWQDLLSNLLPSRSALDESRAILFELNGKTLRRYSAAGSRPYTELTDLLHFETRTLPERILAIGSGIVESLGDIRDAAAPKAPMFFANSSAVGTLHESAVRQLHEQPLGQRSAVRYAGVKFTVPWEKRAKRGTMPKHVRDGALRALYRGAKAVLSKLLPRRRSR